MKALAIALLVVALPSIVLADTGDVITRGVMADLFDLVVGHSHHVLEANLDEGEAKGLMLARSAGNRSGIEALTKSDTYKHYGDDGTDGDPPMCKVRDQDPVALDDGTQQPASPVSCTLANGSTLYVIRWTR